MPELWLYDAKLLGGPGPDGTTLVWRTAVTADAIDQLMLIDAARGNVALSIDQIEHARSRVVCDQGGVVSANYSCAPSRTPVRSEGQAATGNADVDLAYEYAGDTYDLYAGLGRDSLDDQGLPLRSTVRHCPTVSQCPYANAFWDGAQMVYGAGFAAADDVVGHELTHGVTDFSARLFYYYQSGAINESISDVFGEFVDQTNGAGTDNATTKWQLGEDIPGFGAGRDMENPPTFGDPDRMTSANYTANLSEDDGGGVHTNSGVNNKAAFLMTDGGTFNGVTVTGLGIPKVSRIYYETLTQMLTSASDYADLASALRQSCANLVGTAGITAGDCVEVGDATAAVEMSVSPPAAPTPVDAPVCATGTVPTDLFADDMENRASGNWSLQSGWYYSQDPNPYDWDPSYATSGTHNLWGDDPGGVSDASIAMTRSVAVPAGATAYLRFNHAYGFDDDSTGAYDGGMVEISTNNGVSYSDIGGLMTDNPYNGTIATISNNPLEGRAAYVRESNGYVSSRATLSSLAGRAVRFRFRIATDGVASDYGWFVDDVRIYTCAPPGSTGTPPGGTGTPTGGGGTIPPPAGTTTRRATLADARVRSCKRTGSGKKARVKCTLKSSGAVRRATIKVTRGKKTVATGTIKPKKGVLTIKLKRKLRAGKYKVAITVRDAAGRKRTLRTKLTVR